MINYFGEYKFLSVLGITDQKEKAIWCTSDMIEDCIYRAGQYSIYSVEEQIKQGFITAANGERIGLAGEYVSEKGKAITIRNFTSIFIRVPHIVVGSGETFYRICMSDIAKNVLLISAPGLGKTTILRDVARILSDKTQKNILLCDERGELGVGTLGISCDVLKFADKATAFESGIRAMRPDILITDEISDLDCQSIKRAIYAGVRVVASAHFSDIEHVISPFYPLFDRYVLLDGNEIGKIKAVYDEQKRLIYSN